MSIDRALAQFEASRDAAVGRLCDWLRIPSVSTRSEHKEDCRKAGMWLVEQLRGLGMGVHLRQTPGHGIVRGSHFGPNDGSPDYRGPHILFYGHYDVQPAEPLEQWTSPPFEPTIVDGPNGPRIVARGASDDKGQVMMFVEALRAWKDATGDIPCRVTLLVEGEEECGSINLPWYLEQSVDDLVGPHAPHSPCDVALVCDTGMWDAKSPAITTSLRGLAYLEVTLKGPGHDLHSGAYGNVVANPAIELARILGNLIDPDTRRVRLAGFYAAVVEAPDDRRAAWQHMNAEEKAYLAAAGVDTSVGETGYSWLERQWVRPSLDINGMISGYTAEGAKTIIPACASAKVSCRLVPNQDPEQVEAAFRAWVTEQLPPTITAEFRKHVSANPWAVDPSNPYVQVAADCLQEVFDRPAIQMGSGGSIPVVEQMKRILGIDALLVGFALPTDRIHAPNEHFDVARFEYGTRSLIRMLGRFAEMQVR